MLVVILCLLSYSCAFQKSTRGIIARRLLQSTATTYVPVDIPIANKKSTLLIKSDEEILLQELRTQKNRLDETTISLWVSEGKARWLEESTSTITKLTTVKKPKFIRDKADTYFNLAPATSKSLYLVKSTKAADVLSGSLSFLEAERRGEAFKNLTEMMIDYNVTSRADTIASRVKNEFPIASAEWLRWTNQTIKYNATSLTQVMSEYFANHSIGDIGTKGIGNVARYIPKRGFPGTLAPGENFIENDPIDSLSHHILHPWPAMQEIQFHVRMPPNHPMLPPPLLWFGLNNMYTENYTNHLLNMPSTETIGGMMMHPKDAVRIARSHKVTHPPHLTRRVTPYTCCRLDCAMSLLTRFLMVA